MDGVRHYWCCDRLRDQEGEGRKRAKKRAKEPSASASAASLRSLRSLRSSELYAETGCRSGGNAYEHNTLPVYQEYGLEGFRVCTLFRPNIVALALLRDPLQRWLSGLYYWGQLLTQSVNHSLSFQNIQSFSLECNNHISILSLADLLFCRHGVHEPHEAHLPGPQVLRSPEARHRRGVLPSGGDSRGRNRPGCGLDEQ